MYEIYIKPFLYEAKWLNIFEPYILTFIFFFFVLYLMVIFLSLISSNRGKFFKKVSSHLLILSFVIILSIISGLAIQFFEYLYDFNKIVTDGKQYIATHTTKFWKEYKFTKDDISKIYYKQKKVLVYVPRSYSYNVEYGYIIIIELKNKTVITSDFISDYYDEDNPRIIISALQRVNKIISATGLTDEGKLSSVYPRWLTYNDFFKRIKTSILVGGSLLLIGAFALGLIILLLKIIAKNNTDTVITTYNFDNNIDNNIDNSMMKDISNIDRLMNIDDDFDTKLQNISTFQIEENLKIDDKNYNIIIKGNNDKISIECNGVMYNSIDDIRDNILKERVKQILQEIDE